MDPIIVVDTNKCVGCNACVRNCPAPEANITKQLDNGKFVTTVNPDRCITCGECVRTCNHGARDYLDDTAKAIAAMKTSRVIILATPSIKSVFPTQWKSILDWFKKEGCLVYDVSLGADICTWAHLRAIQHKRVGNLITQPCAAIVKYIEIYQPTLLANLSPIHSPISCAITYIRKYLHQSQPIAVLSPCIAKKTEFAETGLAEYNVTFKKLMEYFDKNSIKIPFHQANAYSYAFDEQQGQVGAVYPRPGGLRDNIWMHDPDINITTSEGVHKVYPELDMYAEMPEFKHPEVFDVLSCEFGCNVGPASGTSQTVFDVMATMREVEKEAKTRRKTSFRGGVDKLFKKFDEELNLNDFIRSYHAYNQSPVPTDDDLEPIYQMMGKHTKADREYNCHACGYASCKAMATAIFRGLNTADNCIVHAKSTLLARHSVLSEQHEKLSEITTDCIMLSGKLKADIGTIVKSMSNIGDAANATSSRASIVNGLLENVISYCDAHKTDMNIESVEQLIEILKTTREAFTALDSNVNITNENSTVIQKSINDISELVDKINNTLLQSTDKMR